MNFHPRLFQQARALGLLFLLAVLASFLVGGLAILQSYQLSRVVAGVFIENLTLAAVSGLLRVIFAIVILRVFFTIAAELLAAKMAAQIKERLRQELLSKINRLGPEFLKNEKTAELTLTALQGVDALDSYYSQYLPQVFIAGMLPLTILVVIFPLDLLTGIVFVLTAPLIPLFMVLIGKAAEGITQRQWLALTRLGSYFLDTLQGIATLKMLGRSRDRAAELRRVNEDYRDKTLSVLRITFLSALVLELIATISTAVVAVEIGLRLLYGRMLFQEAFFILLIAPDFYLPLRSLSARYHAGMTGVTAAKRIFELLDTTEPQDNAYRGVGQLETCFAGDFTVSINQLSFTYTEMTEHSLRNVDFSINKGTHYALVGMSGSGKSTLARLLLRFLEPSQGEIHINGMNIQDWTKAEWRRFAGWIPQQPFIFNTTMGENITLGDARFTQGEIEMAMQQAGLEGLVSRLPMGVETPLLESGARFSGGELQRVALARLFLRSPALLVLDEPTSHLDPELQRSLEDTILKLAHGRTTLTIAHRLSAIERADVVLFLENGALTCRGPHTELLNTVPAYRDFILGKGDVR